MWNQPRCALSQWCMCHPLWSWTYTISFFTDFSVSLYTCLLLYSCLVFFSLVSSYRYIFPLTCIRMNISFNIACLWFSLAFYSVSWIPYVPFSEVAKRAEVTLIQRWQPEGKEKSGASPLHPDWNTPLLSEVLTYDCPECWWQGRDSEGTGRVLFSRGFPVPTEHHPSPSTW